MKKPPYYLQPILHTIETVIVQIKEEFPRLVDKDVEDVLTRLEKYYKTRSRNKNAEEPEVHSERKQALIDEILNAIEAREELEADIQYIKNPEVLQGFHQIPTLEHLYCMALKRLRDSVRFWRKEHGATGYLKYISNFI